MSDIIKFPGSEDRAELLRIADFLMKDIKRNKRSSKMIWGGVAALIILLFLGAFSIYKILDKPFKDNTYIRSYVTKNGTYVAPHFRTPPDSSKNNNWSTKGSTNPYTGKKGYINP